MNRIALSLALVAFAAGPALAQTAVDQKPGRIVLSGEGEASVRPDMATLSLTVLRQGETAREALDANNGAMAAVLAAMKAEGIAETDLQTSGFSIRPRYVYPKEKDVDQEPKIIGYEVVNTLGVRVHDLDKVGNLLDRSVTLGVNQGGDISFTTKDPSAAMSVARKRAVEDALQRAKTLTEAAGVGIGKIIEINEETRGIVQPMPMMARSYAAKEMDSVPVAAGENSYRVQINVTFEIIQ